MKTLKTLVCLLLVLSMIFCLAACGDDKDSRSSKSDKADKVEKDDEDEKKNTYDFDIDPDDYVQEATETEASDVEEPFGTYHLYKAEYEVETITAVELGLEMSITFDADGTGYITDADGVYPFEWAGNVFVDELGEMMEFEFVDGEIILESEGTRMFFTPGQYSTAGGYEGGEANYGDEPFGTYVLYKAEYEGVIVTAEEMGLEMSITFDADGTGYMTDADGDYPFEWSGNTFVDEFGEMIEFEFVEGEILIEIDGTLMFFY